MGLAASVSLNSRSLSWNAVAGTLPVSIRVSAATAIGVALQPDRVPLDAAHTPRLCHLAQRPSIWALICVSIQVPAGVAAFHEAMASVKAKLVVTAGLVASPTKAAAVVVVAPVGGPRGVGVGARRSVRRIKRQAAVVEGHA